MFANAIKTLSDMALNESGFEVPKNADEKLLEEFKVQVESLPLLTEEEAEFQVYMVPIHQNKRFGRYLIEMEDLSRYMASSNIHNVKEAVCNILNANGLQGQYANTGIIVDENGLLADCCPDQNCANDCNANKPVSKDHFDNSKAMGFNLIKQSDMNKIRQIANTKKFMDALTGRYGLPLFKKNYDTVGLLKEMTGIDEDKLTDQPAGTAVIHEGPKCSCGKAGCKICNPKKLQENGADNEAGRTEQPGDEDFNENSRMNLFKKNQATIQETVRIAIQENNSDNIDPHDAALRRIKSIIAGEMDDV